MDPTDKEPPITVEDIAIMEKFLGISLRPEDRELAKAKINENLNNFQTLRSLSLPNSLPPSLYFLPRGKFKSEPSEVVFSLSQKNILPDDLNELAFFSIIDLAYFIKHRMVTCVRLMEIFLGRIGQHDHDIKSIVTLNPKALTDAKKMDELLDNGTYLGMLHGIPFGAKDLLSYPGMPTTWGTPPYQDQTFEVTATVIERLTSKGAVLLGKLSLGELAWGDVWFGGMTKTPWNLEFGSSGSSSGSAAAVASGFVTFAIGSETHGSIVSPSTRCGVTGLRPTFGRVSRYGAMALSWSMDKLGPICHTVEDCAIVFNAIYGPDGKDPTVADLPFSWDPNKNIDTLKIGYLPGEFEKDEKHHKWNFEVLELLKSKGINILPIDLPNLPYKEILFILHCEAAAAFDDLTVSGQVDTMIRQGEDTWPNVFRWARFIPAVEYIKANRIRTWLIESMNQIFEKIDILIGPSLGDNLGVTNLTGHPCVVLPTGFKEDKLPTSITFMSGLHQEDKLMLFAKYYQDLTEFHKYKPIL